MPGTVYQYDLAETIQELAAERGLEEGVVLDVLARALEEHYRISKGWAVDVYWDGQTLAARRVIRRDGRWVEVPVEITPQVVAKLKPVFVQALSWEVTERRRQELKAWVHQAVIGEVMAVQDKEVWVWLEGARARGILPRRAWLPRDQYRPGVRLWVYVSRLDKLTPVLDRRTRSLPLALLRAWGWRGKAKAIRRPGEWTLLLIRQGEIGWELRDRLARALGERVWVRWVVR